MEKQRSLRAGFVGAGRLAGSLAAGLQRAGYPVTAVASAHRESARRLAALLGEDVAVATNPGDVTALSDIVFLTVPDDAIPEACGAIPWESRHIAVHCSGALGLESLAAAATNGATSACFHPLQTFPSRVPEAERFAGVFCGIEGSEPAGSLLEGVARDLGAHPFRLEGIDRALYHAAAVMSSNLVVALMAAATRLWELAGLEALQARPALSPLLLAAATNVSNLELAQALTGPVARGDVATVERHLSALRDDPALLEIYRRLSGELLALPLDHHRATAERLSRLLQE